VKNIDIYKSWRDKLLSMISENICTPCTDKRKEQFNIDNCGPLLSGCRCHRVEKILENVKNIDEYLEKYANEP